MIYLVNGIIFQNGNILGIEHQPVIGAVTTIQPGFIYAICNGVIFKQAEENESDAQCGEIQDKWGHSIVTAFRLSDTKMSFLKHYKNRLEIFYSFEKRQDGIWYGVWSGLDCGAGQSKFILTPVEENFFNPEPE